MKKAQKKPAAKAGAKKMKSKAKPKSKMSAKAKTKGSVKAKGKTPTKMKSAGKKAAPKKPVAKREPALKLVSLQDLAQDAMQTQIANSGAGPQAAHPPKVIPPHELTQNKAAFKAKAPKNVRNNRTNGAGARHH